MNKFINILHTVVDKILYWNIYCFFTCQAIIYGLLFYFVRQDQAAILSLPPSPTLKNVEAGVLCDQSLRKLVIPDVLARYSQTFLEHFLLSVSAGGLIFPQFTHLQSYILRVMQTKYPNWIYSQNNLNDTYHNCDLVLTSFTAVNIYVLFNTGLVGSVSV